MQRDIAHLLRINTPMTHSLHGRAGRRGRRSQRHAPDLAHDHASWLRGLFHGDGGGTMRRGNVRYAILAVLQDRPMHGYQVIQELESRTDGRWRPSAGSVYPTLQLLEDEGLVTSEDVDGRRTYNLTDAGRRAASDLPRPRRFGPDADSGADTLDVRRLAMHLVAAAAQVKRMGSPEANREAREILTDSRKKLYRLLADDTDADEA
jgi:DNA-binding PadR family transcriptional regulator